VARVTTGAIGEGHVSGLIGKTGASKTKNPKPKGAKNSTTSQNLVCPNIQQKINRQQRLIKLRILIIPTQLARMIERCFPQNGKAT
jgi:hypothetical protein